MKNAVGAGMAASHETEPTDVARVPDAAPLVAVESGASASPKPSEVLRGILSKNPGVKTFTLERILSSIGSDRFGASLMVLAIPTVVPVPGRWGVAVPSGIIGCQLVAGQKQIKLPRFILKRSISRRALAVAIHAALPLLEAAEKVLRPRWSWATHPAVRRVVGLLVFLLAIAIAHPLLGLDAVHATSIFVMSLGMAEQDGLAVVLGALVGILSLTIVAVSSLSARALYTKAMGWLGRGARTLGLAAFAVFLRQHGYDRLARIVTLQLSDLVLLWNPEARVRRPARPVTVADGQRTPTQAGSGRGRGERTPGRYPDWTSELPVGC